MHAGPLRQTPRPQERAGTVRGTVRVISPAPLPGALRGVPARWGRRRRASGSGSGEGLPLRLGDFVPVMFAFLGHSIMVAR